MDFFFLTEVKQETCLLVCLQFKGPQLEVYISQQNIHDGLVSTGVFSACSDAFSQTTESLSIRVSASWLDLVGVWLLNPPTWFGPQLPFYLSLKLRMSYCRIPRCNRSPF